MDEAQFRQQCLDEGYGEAAPLECEPNMKKDMHTHDFSAYAMVLRGEFTVARESGSTTHKPGETCKVDAGTLHAEQTGPDGATAVPRAYGMRCIFNYDKLIFFGNGHNLRHARWLAI